MRQRSLLLLIGSLLLAGGAAWLVLHRSTRKAGSNAIIEALRRNNARTGAPAGPRPPRSPVALDPTRLPQLVRDTGWMVRLTAADAVVQSPNLPGPRRAELLLDALNQEVATPAVGRPLAGSYLSLSGTFRLRYIHMLEDLGPAAQDPARAAMHNQTGVRREWATVALGAAGAAEAAPALRQLLRRSSETDVRMSAAYFLGRLGDKSAVADLKAALSDPATAKILADDSGDRDRILYPVREQAAGALMTLGLRVERNGHTFTAH